MIHAINTQIRTPFFEGAGQTGCMQKLRNLVTTIKDAIVRVFQCILPCIFRKKITPAIQTAAAVSVLPGPSPLPQQPIVQPIPPATQQKVTQAVTIVTAAVLQPPALQPLPLTQLQPLPQATVVQQPQPIQQPVNLPVQIQAPAPQPVPTLHIPHEDKGGNINAMPDHVDEIKDGGGLSCVIGTKGLSPEQSNKAIFVILNAFNRLWSFIENNGEFKGGDLDAIIDEALTNAKVDEYIKGNNRPPFRDIVQNEYKKLVIERIVHIIKINRQRKDKSIRVTDQSFFPLDKMIKILMKNAKDKKSLLGAVLISKYPTKNPSVYGLFVKYNETEEARSYDLYLLDPYKEKNKFISFQKLSEQALRKQLPNVVGDDSDESDNDIPVDIADSHIEANVKEAPVATAHYCCIPLTKQSNRSGNAPFSPNNGLGIEFGFDTMFE